MGAPAVTGRQAPDGIKMKEGYQILFAFSANPDLAVWEKDVTPPGFDQGDKIDQTNQHNTAYMTSAPRVLTELTDGSLKVGYDPDDLSRINNMTGQQQAMTVHFPNGATMSFFGYLKSFVPDALVIGQEPVATMTVVVTNVDPLDCEEAGPIIVAGNGSCV